MLADNLIGFHANLIAVLVIASAEPAAPARPHETEKPTTKRSSQDDGPARKPNLYVQLLEQLYLEGQPDAVMVGVRSANDAIDLDPKARAQIALLEGMVQVDLVQEQAAKDSFNRALALDYDTALPGDASTKAAELFKAIRTEYQQLHKRPEAPKSAAEAPSTDAWKWGLLGGGALGAIAGIVVLAASNGQQGAPGGLLLGAGAATAVGGIVALSIPVPGKEKASVSVEVSPRGDVMALCTARF